MRCEALNTLISQAWTGDLEDAQPIAGSERCFMSRLPSGADSYHCAWSYPYRDEAANAAFEALNQELRNCLNAGAESADDQEVNHPDSYDQRRYQSDEVTVTISIKDKGALNRTYVFVGVYGANSE